MEKEFNYENFEREAIEQLRAGRGALGKDGVLMPLLKRFLEKSVASRIGSSFGGRKSQIGIQPAQWQGQQAGQEQCGEF